MAELSARVARLQEELAGESVALSQKESELLVSEERLVNILESNRQKLRMARAPVRKGELIHKQAGSSPTLVKLDLIAEEPDDELIDSTESDESKQHETADQFLGIGRQRDGLRARRGGKEVDENLRPADRQAVLQIGTELALLKKNWMAILASVAKAEDRARAPRPARGEAEEGAGRGPAPAMLLVLPEPSPCSAPAAPPAQQAPATSSAPAATRWQSLSPRPSSPRILSPRPSSPHSAASNVTQPTPTPQPRPTPQLPAAAPRPAAPAAPEAPSPASQSTPSSTPPNAASPAVPHPPAATRGTSGTCPSAVAWKSAHPVRLRASLPASGSAAQILGSRQTSDRTGIAEREYTAGFPQSMPSTFKLATPGTQQQKVFWAAHKQSPPPRENTQTGAARPFGAYPQLRAPTGMGCTAWLATPRSFEGMRISPVHYGFGHQLDNDEELVSI